jgi:hypothetical protein
MCRKTEHCCLNHVAFIGADQSRGVPAVKKVGLAERMCGNKNRRINVDKKFWI